MYNAAPPKISLIIHNLNRAGVLRVCLGSVLAQTHRPLEVVIMDAGSTDGSLDIIHKAMEAMRASGMEPHLDLCEPTGVASSRNRGASLASGDLLAFLDNDAILASGALNNAARRFAADARLGVLSFRVLLRDSNQPDPYSWIYRRPAVSWNEREFETFTFTGGACCIRTEAFREAGGYWEILKYSREEEDLCLRLVDRGWKIFYSPDSLMRHFPGPMSLEKLTLRRFFELQNGLLVLWRRLPLPLALFFCLLRILSMTLRLIVKDRGGLLQLLKAIPAAAALWRQSGAERTPIAWSSAMRFLELHFHGQARLFEDTDVGSRVDILGCPFDAISFGMAVERVKRAILANERLHIVTGNVDIVMKARKDEAFAKAIRGAGLVVADGVPVLWAARFLGTPLPGRVNGTELAWECARIAAETGCGLALVGAAEGVAERAATRIAKRYGGKLTPVDTPTPLTEEGCRIVVERIRNSGARIVLAALGAPKQDFFLRDHLAASGANVGIGIGSAFDIIAMKTPRAPRWMRGSGLEWLYRLFREPKRLWRRYLIDDMPFFWYLFREWQRRKMS